MQDLILRTGWSALVLRLTAGLIMLPHGIQKISGFKGTMDYFTNTTKLPWVISFTVILIECLGPIGLMAGALTRFWASALIVVMTGAIITTNQKNGLFMNWYGNQAGEGYEYHLLFIGICIAIIIIGGGEYSIDKRLLK